MKQAALDLNLSLKKTRKREFLEQMERVVPWAALVALIAPYYPEGRTGRPPFELETMLRTHFLQQWFSLSDPAMEEAFCDVPLYREFARLDSHGRLPDESTILRFRHRLEKHKLADEILASVNRLLSEQGLMLRAGAAVDATSIAAPSSTKNKDGKRVPEMHSSKKGTQWHFGMKTHIGVDADSGLLHTVRSTAGHVAGVTEGSSLLHCIAQKPSSLPMRATRALTSGPMPGRTCAGRWPCALESAGNWTRQTTPSMRSSTRSRSSRPASVPRSSIHFVSSSASSGL